MSDLIVRHTQSEMVLSLAAYLPGGELFESAFIPGTNFNALLEGLSGELLRAENFLFLYNSQFIPDQTTVFIEEWESALGIPDDCFTVSDGDTNEQRRLNILVKLASLGVQTSDDFVNLATILGFSGVEVLPGVGSNDDSIVNGTFDIDSDWTLGTGWTIFAGTANHLFGAAGDLTQDITAVTGTLYVLTYDVAFTDTGTVTPDIGGTEGIARSENGTYQEVIECGSANTLISMKADSSFNGSVDNIVVNGSLAAGGTPRFTIVVKFNDLVIPNFPLSFPIPFGDSSVGILECLFTKLKPANCDIVFEIIPFVPADTFLSVANTGSPFVMIYKRSGDAFTKLSDPDVLPTGNGNEIAFSPDDVYLSVAHVSSPFVTTYKRSGDVFTKLSNPVTLPNANGNGVAFSPESIYLSVVYASSPFITIYKRSGDVFTALSNPSTLPTGNAIGTTFSSDDVYLAVAHHNSPRVTIYKRSGDVFTKLDNPSTLPTGNGTDVAFSPDVVYLSVSHVNSPFVTIYKRSGDVFTKLDNPSTLPTGSGTNVAFSPDGVYLAVAHTVTPFLTIYKRSGDVFTKLADPSVFPPGNGIGVSFSSDNVYLAFGHSGSPFVTIYKRSGDVFTSVPDPDVLPSGNGNGVSFSNL